MDNQSGWRKVIHTIPSFGKKVLEGWWLASDMQWHTGCWPRRCSKSRSPSLHEYCTKPWGNHSLNAKHLSLGLFYKLYFSSSVTRLGYRAEKVIIPVPRISAGGPPPPTYFHSSRTEWEWEVLLGWTASLTLGRSRIPNTPICNLKL